MSIQTVGTINLTIRIRLNQDITLDEAHEFVEELDYKIEDKTGKVSICETEIVEDDIPEDENGPIGMDDTPPVDFGVNEDVEEDENDKRIGWESYGANWNQEGMGDKGEGSEGSEGSEGVQGVEGGFDLDR